MLTPPTVWADSANGLAAQGFRRRHGDTFAADGVTLTAVHGWATLSAKADRLIPDPPGAMLGRPGLWKPAANGGDHPVIVFDVPLRPLMDRLEEGTDDAGDTVNLVAAIARWAVQTRPGADAPPWQPPPAERIAEILPATALSLRSGPYLQPAMVAAQDDRLALRVTICPLGDPMPAARRQWLDRMLADCRGLRMVRIGVREAGTGAPSLDAEVDLTGAPPGVLEATLPVALDALQACFSLLAATATFVCDPHRRSRALDRDPAELLKRYTNPSSTTLTRRTRA